MQHMDGQRVSIMYPNPGGGDQEEVEIPLRILVIGDFTGREDERTIAERKPLTIDKEKFDQVLAAHEILVDIVTHNTLDEQGGSLNSRLTIHSLADLRPEAIIDQLTEAPLISRVLANRRVLALESRRSSRSAQPRRLEAINARLSALIRLILHAPEFEHIEAQWRGLWLLVNQINFRANIRLDILSMTKEELSRDFDESPDLSTSGLYQHLYRSTFGAFGGMPYAVVTTTFDVDASAEDLRLLGALTAIGALAHAPILSNASARFLGLNTFGELPREKDLSSVFEEPSYARWVSLRERDDARYLGLCLPRILLRAPYGDRESELSVRGLAFNENIDGDERYYLWGPASLALTARLAQSFERNGWNTTIIGTHDGTLSDLPCHIYQTTGDTRLQMPSEVIISERQEYELSRQGFISLISRVDRGNNNAAFYSAWSVRRPRYSARTEDGVISERNHTLNIRLPNTFMISRLAHYLKVIYRDGHLDRFFTPDDLERVLNRWLRSYVCDMPDPSPHTRSRRPLRTGKVCIEALEGETSWYRFKLEVEPHFKYEGMTFTLSLVGWLDRVVR